MNKIILFDIDQTLIKRYERSGNVWSNLFKKIYGCESGLGIGNVVSQGKTMKQIVFEALAGEGFKNEEIGLKWPLFKKVLIEEYIPLLKSVEPFEDADETLKDLGEKGCELGLITGNLKEIAIAKLKLAGLNNYFSFGGFGDSLTRNEVARAAIKYRGGSSVFLVGDTPLDILAGKEIGAKTVGVATGIYSVDDLKEAGADIVVNNLKQLVEELK